ncbi:TPA: class I SAM-dependent methyltransferase [Legionella pneumophila]|nr:methyltransferase [Legionella pneumophila serogroup 9]HAT1990294.1 class I SAM-dependent methyltransferase [Legionella pneumophila]HAT1993465.1 class I SAM-dependent methyltransferase [Legionella pneumophila]HAT2050862.1 class I SAM-dependent methyltransferase [Legionella pneumophila]HAT2056329.1 class I SAM-dependent methyltransferase [Legionella pneumophila]
MSAQYKNYQHYLIDGWKKEPKEMFKFIASKMDAIQLPDKANFLDVGCATGEFIYYLSSRFSQFRYTGIDVFDDLILECKKLQPEKTFLNASVLDLPKSFDKKFDIITVVSVISIFDENELSLFWNNLFRAIKDGGVIFLLSPFNEFGVDCEIRHRKRIDNNRGDWERGWNIFCKETIIEHIESRCNSWEFHPFKFNLNLNPRKDPVRTWTMKTEHNDKQLVNGLKLMIDHYLLQINV